MNRGVSRNSLPSRLRPLSMTLSECLASPDKLFCLLTKAATDEARAAGERPQKMACLSGIAVFLDGRFRGEFER